MVKKCADICEEKWGKGVTCPAKSPSIIKKMKETTKDRYGEESYLQTKEGKDKIKKTNNKRYGCDNVFQNESVKKVIRDTLTKNYGVSNPMDSEVLKRKQQTALFENHGVTNPQKSPAIQEKTRNTCLEKYGAPNPMQNAEVAQRSDENNYKGWKDYRYPSGKVTKIQGYENHALDALLAEGFDEDDLITKKVEVPEIWWNDDEGKKHRYYVDIFIKSENRMIEVKSKYTFEIRKVENLKKQQACKDSGHEHEIWVLDGRGEMIQTIRS